MKCFVLNGWAASERAWELCRFRRDRIFSYVEQLDGEVEKALDGCENALLVGWSMGGSNALRLLLSHPGKVKALVLVAATPRMMEDKASGWTGMSPRRLDALRRGLEHSCGEGAGSSAGKPMPYVADCDENLERGLKYLRETDLRDGLLRSAPIGVPTVIFQSESDGIVRSSNADFLSGVFGRPEIVKVPGGEHALPVEIPSLIDDAVARLLSV